MNLSVCLDVLNLTLSGEEGRTGCTDLVAMIVIGSFERLPQGQRLEQNPYFIDLRRRLNGQIAHSDPALRKHFDQAAPGQALEGFAKRGGANAPSLGQFIGRKSLSGFEFAPKNGLSKSILDPFRSSGRCGCHVDSLVLSADIYKI